MRNSGSPCTHTLSRQLLRQQSAATVLVRDSSSLCSACRGALSPASLQPCIQSALCASDWCMGHRDMEHLPPWPKAQEAQIWMTPAPVNAAFPFKAASWKGSIKTNEHYPRSTQRYLQELGHAHVHWPALKHWRLIACGPPNACSAVRRQHKARQDTGDMPPPPPPPSPLPRRHQTTCKIPPDCGTIHTVARTTVELMYT